MNIKRELLLDIQNLHNHLLIGQWMVDRNEKALTGQWMVGRNEKALYLSYLKIT